MEKQEIVIDATDWAVGRLASYAAKQALLGKSIKIVNCNDAVIVGNPKSIFEEYHQMASRKSTTLRGPFYPKTPERMLKRAVRGMLPYKKGRGRDALKSIICYNKVPAKYENVEKMKTERKIRSKTMKLKKLSEII